MNPTDDRAPPQQTPLSPHRRCPRVRGLLRRVVRRHESHGDRRTDTDGDGHPDRHADDDGDDHRDADRPYDGWFSNTRTVSTTTVAFAPAAVRVSQGATATWEWVVGRHDVRVEEQPDDAGWNGHPDTRAESGYTDDHALETPGRYLYYCSPHLQMGTNGPIVVDASSVGGGTATE